MDNSVMSKNPAFGWSPISRRYIKRSGAVYKRLVMSGVVTDPEISTILENPASGSRSRPRAPNRVQLPEPTPDEHDPSLNQSDRQNSYVQNSMGCHLMKLRSFCVA
jgi:hypothetical protein